MSAFVIADVTVTDPAGYERYKQLTPAAIGAFGGRFVARGGEAAALEGDWQPARLVIGEFPRSNERGRGTTRSSTERRRPCASARRGPTCSSSTAYDAGPA
jgi:uncharacterized protein (DUF1330 family)